MRSLRSTDLKITIGPHAVRVALFLHRAPPAHGGAESYAARLAAFHFAQGDEVDIWASTALDLGAMTGPGRHHPETRDAVRRYRPLTFPGRRYILKVLSLVPHRPWQCLTRPANPTCPGMWRDAGLVAVPYDAVHALAFPHSFPALCGLRLARRLGVPFALTPFLHLGDPDDPHDPTRRQYTAAPLRWLLRQADVVFTQTGQETDAVIGLGVPRSKVVRQGLGVEPADCTGGQRKSTRAAWGVRPSEVVVGHLANLSEEKGSADLLRAARLMRDSPRVVFAGPEMPNFARLWSAGVPPSVTKFGPLSESAKRDFYAAIDLFCLPSRSDSFGLVLLEAWSNSVPVVVYRAGGPAELVRDRVDGIQIMCGDVAGLAETLTDLAANGELRRRLGDAGRARVAGGEFDWERSLAVVRAAFDSRRRGG